MKTRTQPMAQRSRRRFLQRSAALSAGLLLELSVDGRVAARASAPVSDTGMPLPETVGEFVPNAWVRITPDNRVLLVVHKFDSGTGVKNALGMMLAEELDADWPTVQVIQPEDPLAKVYMHPLWGMIATGGSTSVSSDWMTLRRAGAAARAMLVAAAAQQWSVAPAVCVAEKSRVRHPPSGRVLTYGELSVAAARQPVPTQIVLKRPQDFKLIGKLHRSYGVEDKVTGRAKYAIDLKLPGMLTAIVVHPPVVNATVRHFDEAAVRAVPGVHDVFALEIPATIVHFRQNMPPAPPANGACQPGIAIVAENFWAAQKARAMLRPVWSDSAFDNFDSAGVIETMKQHVDDEGLKARIEGDPKAAFAAAEHVVEAVYTMPYKAHAQMEPLSVAAWVKPDEVEYWGGIQVPSRCAQASETIAKVPRDKVKIHITEAGGSFGSREGLHQLLEVTYIAKRAGRPVKLLYSREDDMRGLFYQTASVHKARAALAADGQLAAVSLRAVVPSIKEPDDPGFLRKFPVDPSCTEAMHKDFSYDIGALDLAWVRHEPGFPIWWWRAVSFVPNVFAIESIIDEAASAAGQDPYQYRRRLLRQRPAHLAVLERAAELVGWPAYGRHSPGRGLGLATFEGYGSYIAVVADVNCVDREIRINRITCVVDCGLAVDPSSVHQQLAGGIHWGITTALHNEIHVENGQVRESNFDGYPVVRIDRAPPLEIVLMPPSGRSPGGIGELSNPAVTPAIANAIFAATGQRLRSTPFRLA